MTHVQEAPLSSRIDANGRLRIKGLGEVTVADVQSPQLRPDLPPLERASWMFRMLETIRDFPHHFLPINSYQHCLQTATRARRAGEDDEMVVAALFHDLYDDLGTRHAHPAAELLKGYVSPDIYWMVRHHAVFQNRYKQYLDAEHRNAYLEHKGHPAFDLTLRFTADYDEPAFDPDYDTLPLEAFSEAASKVFASARYPVT
jgi:predicted HD phosphohydrolase